MSERDLIVLAAPRSGDPYYADSADDILAFHAGLARAAEGVDDVLVLTDAHAHKRYVGAIGGKGVMVAPMADVWLRDIGPVNPIAPVMFHATGEGHGGRLRGRDEAARAQHALISLLDAAGVAYRKVNLRLDGGNVVTDDAGHAVIGRKVLRDTGLGEAALKSGLKKLGGIEQVAFVDAGEPGAIEHAERACAFIGPNIVVVNGDPEDRRAAATLRADLGEGLPDVTIHEIATPEADAETGGAVFDTGAETEGRIYTEMLTTPRRIYLPQFGIPEDRRVQAELQQWSPREVVPVRAERIAAIGGGPRSLSFQLRGRNARKLMSYVAKNRQ